MDYVETTEQYTELGELQSDLNKLMGKIRGIGARQLDVEISVDLLAFTITIVAPEGTNIDAD